MADVAKMYDLQKVDTLWEKVRRRLLQIRKQLVESDDLQAKRQTLAALEAELQQWQSEQRTAELESQSLADRITDTETRLMSGQVRNPKELDALQHSVEALRRQRDGVETTGVTALLKIEEVTAKRNSARDQMLAIERKWRAEQAGLLEEENKLKRAFVQCKKQREALAAGLAGESLIQYEELRRRKAGIAVATVERGLCSACHVQVPTGVASSARNQTGATVYCTSCARILYAGG